MPCGLPASSSNVWRAFGLRRRFRVGFTIASITLGSSSTPQGTGPTPSSCHPSLDAEGSPHAVRTLSNALSGAARLTMRRHPIGSRKAQARRLRGDHRHCNAATSNRARAAMRPMSAQRVRVAVAVLVPDRRGDHVGFAWPYDGNRQGTKSRGQNYLVSVAKLVGL